MKNEKPIQITTFNLFDEVYGIDIHHIQEVTDKPKVTPIPLAPDHISGLINLRGQISTGINLKKLFAIIPESSTEFSMSVICKNEGQLLSLLVDKVGDVITINQQAIEPVPAVVPVHIAKFLHGVYLYNNQLINIINFSSIASEL